MRRLLPFLAFFCVAMFTYNQLPVTPHQVRKDFKPAQMAVGGTCVKAEDQFANGPTVPYVVCSHITGGTIEWHWSMPENYMSSVPELYFEFTTFHPTKYCEHDGADPGERELVLQWGSAMQWIVECQARTNLADPQPDWDSWGEQVNHASSVPHPCTLTASAPDWLEVVNKVRMSTGDSVLPTGDTGYFDTHIWCRATVDTVLVSESSDVWVINIDSIFTVDGLDQETLVDNPPWP